MVISFSVIEGRGSGRVDRVMSALNMSSCVRVYACAVLSPAAQGL